MCGITGVLNFNREPVDNSLLAEMTNILAHRGPDGKGAYVNNNFGLGHRRLSIIDVTDAGYQPMMNKTETVVVSFNGEIYNFIFCFLGLLEYQKSQLFIFHWHGTLMCC